MGAIHQYDNRLQIWTVLCGQSSHITNQICSWNWSFRSFWAWQVLELLVCCYLRSCGENGIHEQYREMIHQMCDFLNPCLVNFSAVACPLLSRLEHMMNAVVTSTLLKSYKSDRVGLSLTRCAEVWQCEPVWKNVAKEKFRRPQGCKFLCLVNSFQGMVLSKRVNSIHSCEVYPHMFV